jgi:hypothetical protein
MGNQSTDSSHEEVCGMLAAVFVQETATIDINVSVNVCLVR